MKTIRRVIKTALFFGLFFCGFFCVDLVRAYDNGVAHPGIAQMAADLYNAQNEPDLTAEEISWIKQGAEEEDMPTRWLNHFYDPVHQTGFSDLSRIGINNNHFSFSMAHFWAQSPETQIDFALGDRSWQRALADYSDNDRQKAFIELGHVIHLLSDMAVPAHTRNSEHVGDNYESFVKKNWEQIRQNIQSEYVAINNLNNIFTNRSFWTNNNFYSERTIESNKYNILDVSFKKLKRDDGLYDYVALDKLKNVVYYKPEYVWSNNKRLDRSIVLSDYSTRLIPKAIGASAGLIKYFIVEGENLKQEKESMSWWKKFWTDDLPAIRISAYGVLNQMLGYVVGLGEFVQENFSDYSDISLNFITQAEARELLSQAVEIDPQKTAKIKFGDELPNEEIIDSSIALIPTKTTTPDTTADSPEDESIPDAPKEVLADTITDDEDTISPPTTTAPSATSTINKKLSSYAGFDPIIPPLPPVPPPPDAPTSTPTTTPIVEVLPPPVLSDIFNSVISTSSGQINIFGSVTSSALSVSGFYRPSFTTDTPWAELPIAMAVSNTVWQGLFDLTNIENSFIFYAANTATTSDFSAPARILLDNTPPTLKFFNVTSTVATGTTRIDGEFLATDQTALSYNLSYRRNSGEMINIFSASTSTSFSLPIVQSGNYSFVLRACDELNNCVDSESSIIIDQIPFEYIYLDGEQVEDEVILTREHSPYILVSYTVPAGKRLTIEPGVMIKSVPNGSLTIRGEIVGLGDEENKIIFTTVKDQTYNDDILDAASLAERDDNVFHDWYGISLFDNASGTLRFARIKHSGISNYFTYRSYEVECAASFAIFAKDATLNLSEMEFVDAGRADICGIDSQISVADAELDGFTDQTEPRPIFPGRVGIESSGGTLNLTNVIFKNYSYFPVYLNSGAVKNFSEVLFQNNLLDSEISLFYEGNYRYIYQGDGFYVFQATLLNQSLLNTLDLVNNKKIYVMSTAYLTGDLSFSGATEEKFEFILLSEYGGRLDLSGNFNFTDVDIKMNRPNILWFALSGRGMRGAPGVYGWTDGQTYSEFLANNIGMNNFSGSDMVQLNSGSTAVFNNSQVVFGPIPFQFAIHSDNGNLVLNNSAVVWDYADDNSLSLREDLRPTAIYAQHGTIAAENTVFTGFYYGIYSDAHGGFYGGEAAVPDVPADFPILAPWTNVIFDNVVFPSYPAEVIAGEEN